MKGVSSWMIALAAGIIVLVVAVIFFINRTPSLPIEPPREGEKYRFLRYLTCAVAMCSHGYNTPATIGTYVEFDELGNPTKSCNALIDEKFGGYHFSDGEKLCDKRWALDFTFREDVILTGNYSVSVLKPGPCSISKSGLQTDASCIGGWRDTDLIDDCCWECLPEHVDVPPEGLLVSYEHLSACGREGISWKTYPGLIWVPETFADNNCEPWAYEPTWDRGLGQCEFPKDPSKTYYIWAEDARHQGATYADIWIPYVEWTFKKVLIVCVGEDFICPQVIICDHAP